MASVVNICGMFSILDYYVCIGEKEMKLRPRKGGHGHVTSYDASIGSLEAKTAGFVDENGTPLELVKVVDEQNKCIIIKIKDGSIEK